MVKQKLLEILLIVYLGDRILGINIKLNLRGKSLGKFLVKLIPSKLFHRKLKTTF